MRKLFEVFETALDKSSTPAVVESLVQECFPPALQPTAHFLVEGMLAQLKTNAVVRHLAAHTRWRCGRAPSCHLMSCRVVCRRQAELEAIAGEDRYRLAEQLRRLEREVDGQCVGMSTEAWLEGLNAEARGMVMKAKLAEEQRLQAALAELQGCNGRLLAEVAALERRALEVTESARSLKQRVDVGAAPSLVL
jgi:hypothetical protein